MQLPDARGKRLYLAADERAAFLAAAVYTDRPVRTLCSVLQPPAAASPRPWRSRQSASTSPAGLALGEAPYLGWRTRREHEASPTSGTVRMPSGDGPVQ